LLSKASKTHAASLLVAVALTSACGGSGSSDLYGEAGADSGVAPVEEAAADTSVATATPDVVDANSNATEVGPEAVAPGADASQDASHETSIVCGGGGVVCNMPAQVCCVTYGLQQGDNIDACSPSFGICSGQGATPVLCTSSAQCANGSSGKICCGTSLNGSVYYADVSCKQTCGTAANSTDHIFCDPNVPSDCPSNTRCEKSTKLSGFWVCLLTST
jgi:hypothetical protein